MTFGIRSAAIGLIAWFGLATVSAGAAQWQQLLARTAPDGARTIPYVETKHAFYLEQPLRAEGVIEIVPPGRIVKTLQTPRAQRIVLEQDTVTIEKDSNVRTLALDEHIALAALYGVLQDIMLGQSRHIAEHFEVRLQQPAPRWALELVPRTDKLRGWIERIGLVGRGTRLESFTYVEPNGDKAVMEFHEAAAH